MENSRLLFAAFLVLRNFHFMETRKTFSYSLNLISIFLALDHLSWLKRGLLCKIPWRFLGFSKPSSSNYHLYRRLRAVSYFSLKIVESSNIYQIRPSFPRTCVHVTYSWHIGIHRPECRDTSGNFSRAPAVKFKTRHRKVRVITKKMVKKWPPARTLFYLTGKISPLSNCQHMDFLEER